MIKLKRIIKSNVCYCSVQKLFLSLSANLQYTKNKDYTYVHTHTHTHTRKPFLKVVDWRQCAAVIAEGGGDLSQVVVVGVT
jgi:hypothetical protein